jgi:succinoglycan biosynthesis transport protein ExoP
MSGRLNQNLLEYLGIIRRRMAAIVVTIVVIMILIVGFILLAPPRYTASSQIVFDSNMAANNIDLQPVLSRQPPDEAFILSELDVIRSRSLAQRVINKLRLDENSDFNKSLRPADFFSEMIRSHAPVTWLRMWERWQPGWAEALFPSSPPPGLDMLKEQLVDKFQRSVSVTRNNRSRTINVSFTASTPKLAADALNTLTELYLVARMDDRLENAKRASTWLAEQIQELRDRADQADKAVEEYRASHNLFEASRETLISKQVGELNTRLTDASIERREAEANLIQVRRLLNGAGTIDATPQVMQSELIRKYREDELALERRDAQMTQEYGDRHPLLIQLRAEKQRLEEKMRTEIVRIALSLENQAKMARDRENSIQANLQNVKLTMAEANADSIKLRALERQADASKVLLERMMGAILQVSAEESEKSHTPDARLISSAPPPKYPSFPPKLLLLLSGLVISTFLGGILAFVLEHLDISLRSAEGVEAACGLPVLAHVPVIKVGKHGQPADYILMRADSAFGESIRSLFTRLLLTSPHLPSQVILITSAAPGEGKTSISLSLARMQARAGRRVVLIDADFRKSTIADTLKAEASPGLLEVINCADGTTSSSSTAHLFWSSPMRRSSRPWPMRRSLWSDGGRLGGRSPRLPRAS